MSRLVPEICRGFEEAEFSDETVQIRGRINYRGREVGKYVCGNCLRSAFVLSEIMDVEDRKQEFAPALEHAGFCKKAIVVSPFNEGEASAQVTSIVLQ